MRCRAQRGGALVVALFLIVTLAALAAVAVRLTAVQQQTVNVALLSERAFFAAQAGIQWAAHRALNAGTCATASVTLSEAGLNGFTVSVSCSSTTHAEAAATTTVYRLEAFARAGVYGSPDYVSRRVGTVVSRSL